MSGNIYIYTPNMLGFYSYNGLSIMGIYIYIYTVVSIVMGVPLIAGLPPFWETSIWVYNKHVGILPNSYRDYLSYSNSNIVHLVDN